MEDVLKQCQKLGLRLRFNPSGSKNRCFHHFLSEVLGMNDDEFIDDLDSFMIVNQRLPVMNEVGY